MAPQKRRVLVAFQMDAAGGDQKRQRKIAVSIDNTATNADLAREIAATLDEPAVTLEISGGFELRDQDGIDMIAEGDIVTARSCAVGAAGETTGATKEESRSDTPVGNREIYVSPEEPVRIQVRFVTAELARLHARSTPKEHSEATNGILAFDGEFVSGNTSLRSIQQEAVRLLGWASAESMDLDDAVCDQDHENEGACSCSLAQEIEQHGLSSTLHCRFTTDGSNCGNQCPYSHAKLALFNFPQFSSSASKSTSSGICSLCAAALASLCPKCENAESSGTTARSVVHCPLVQNTGCGHLHHAHCVGARRRGFPAGCPSGCPTANFPREAVVFDREDAHLIIAWDGDRIDSIPIPFSMDGVSRDSPYGSIITVTTDTVISIVDNFLEQHKFAHPGHSLRIHSRNPTLETVRFWQSTLVSVCPSSSHLHQGYHRFPLFSTATPSPKAWCAPGPFAIDLHTSQAPIVACGCTSIKRLFPSGKPGAPESSVLLYAVKRRTEVADTAAAPDQREVVSKQSMYLADAAWHPSVPQTPRGIAALLSSLYLLAHSVARKEVAGEQKVLALAYAIFRFPPAVRTLAALFLNKVPHPEDKAALADAVYHALSEFSSRAPHAITSRETRRFETVRILLAYMASAGNAESAALPRRAVDELSLVCALSQKRLRDPVLLDTAVVERAVANLYQPSGPLFRPDPCDPSSIVEIDKNEILPQLLARSLGLRSNSTLVLRVNDIGAPPTAFLVTLDAIARDFVLTIRRANQTDLVTRGPLELKSVDVVAPQIVLDQEGLLAVFTGRGCGTARDVNFFRPTNGGDTEVDVNDVSHALEKVMITRKLENTWQVDSFGEVSAVSRPPDEAIVLCLDLSESMNERSGVTKPVDGNKEESFNVGIEAERLVERLTEDMNDDEIMEKARAHLKSQHASCHHPWWVLVISAGAGITARDLLRELAAIASREALLLSFKEEENDQDTEEDDDFYGDGGTSNRSRTSDALLRLACFATAVTNNDEMHEKLAQFVMDMLQDAQSDVIDPIRPKNAPLRTFVNSTSKAWFESQPRWPLGHCVLEYDSVTKLKKAVATWIAGTDILPKIKKSSKGETISVTFRHLEKDHTWILLPQTPIQTLYSLVNRATQAAYGSFLLLTSHSNAILSSTSHLLISQTDLARGGAIEIQRSTRHTRQPYEIHLEGLVVSTKVLIPRNSSVLALQSYLHTPGLGLSDFIMWHGLTETGDGMRRGQVAELNTLLRYYSQGGDVLSFSCCAWRWFSTDARRSRNESKTLSRLDLLKELLNVFVNRAGSFDTTVSLVLGLVTFSNEASVEQELTPVFENFRERLETVDAKGDTAVYDALDSARQLLTNFRPDLPNLRRRIIIVSDGKDTNSSTSARVVCAALQKSRVIVDSVQVGTTSDPVLHAISVATGGYRFSPRTSLADALSIFDLETMLYSGDRPFRSAKPLVNTERQFQAYQNFSGSNAIDIVTVDKFPARAEHKKLKQRVKSAATSIARPGGGDERMKRIMREIKAVVADPHPNIDVYVNDRDMSFLKIILEAPNDVENCPYKGGTFLLTCDLPTGYPRDPPEVRFVTFILHPNVSKQGKVCIAELGRLWSSDITLKEIFSMIYGILLTPDLENPLEIQASLKYYEDDGTYALAVANAVAKHASKTRAEWQEELND